jgi:precorrin-6A/cobalt-precorrin-6A reductase
VFLATGRQGLARFVNLTGRHLICRVIDPPKAAFPLSNGEFLVGRPPFPPEAERALFESLGVDWLVVKNAGGQASKSKLEAARMLGLPVAMITRPPQPDALRVTTVAAAMDWVRRL